MMQLSDILDLAGMTKEQLAQLCDALYVLLQERNVSLNIQQPFTFAPSVPGLGTLPSYGGPFYQPLGGGTSDPLPEHGYTVCKKD